MGDVGVFVIYATIALITSLGLILGWINYKINKCKDEINDIYVGKENAAAAVGVLEGLIRNLNAVCHDHQKRLDILEEGHPDSEIDYGTVDDNGNITEVWFEGKRYVPEDTIKIYADNKVMAETTRPEEKRCCATCRHYLPGLDHTCTIRPWLHVEEAYANNTHSACNNWKKVYTPTKGQVDYPYMVLQHIPYNNMNVNGKTEQLLKRAERLDYVYSTGLISIATYRNMVKELMQNDS